MIDDQDRFAVWLADAVLRANDDEFGAASLGQMLEESDDSAGFKAELDEASAQEQRPGDFGVEFIGPLLPILLVEFGRAIWKSYSGALLDKGGKALADSTVDALKGLFRKTIGDKDGLSAAEQQLRGVALRSGLSSPQADTLIATLHNPKLAQTLVDQ